MGTSYVRQSSMADGDTITAALFNDEFNRLLTAFSYASSSTTGHQHDGTAGEGGNIHTIGDQDFLNKIVADSTNNRWGFFVEVSSSAVEQIRIQDGAIVPVTDNDIDLGTSSLEFKDAYFDGTVTTDALVADTADINGGTVDGATIGASSATTIVGTTITANTAFVPDASDGAALGTSALEFSDLYLADGAVIYLGDDQDVSLTHVADTGLLLSSTNQLQFGDSGTYIHQSADGVLDLVSDTEIEINATTIDINGAVDVSGNLGVGGNLTVTGTTTLNGGTLTLGDAATDNVVFGADVNSSIIPNTDSAYDLGSSGQEWRDIYIDGTAYLDAINFNGTVISATAAELNILDDVTATTAELNYNDTGAAVGTVVASKVVTVDANKDVSSFRNITLTGELDAATLDISGNADIDGTLEADAITVDGTALNEFIADTVGAMVGSNTESGITVAYQDGDNTLDFTVGTLNQDTTGTAAVATTVTITDNESTNENNAIIFTAGGDLDGGNLGLESDGDLTYNPSTGLLSSTGVTASGTVTFGTLSDGTIGVTAWVDEDNMSSDSATLVPTQQSVKAYVDAQISSEAGTMSSFILEDDDGTEVSISNAKEVKFIGSGVTTNWTDTDNGTDGDPYDLTFTVDAAQTGITSIYATDLIMGEDAQTAIDFGTANEIDFKVDNAARLTLTASALYPVTDNQIDLGTSSLEFKDAFFDGTVTADAFAGPLTGDVTGNASGTAATVTGAAQSNITSLGTLTTLTVDNVIINGSTIGHTGDTDLMTVASGVLTVAGEVSMTTLDIGGTNVTSTAAELNILDGVTSTAAELNILDGVTSTAAELNILDGVTSTAAELNILDGVTSTAAELNILDGVTSTAAELNLMDGGTTAGTTAVASGDGIVTNDGGTMRQTTVDTFDTYLSASTKTLTNKTLGAVTLSGAVTGADQTITAVNLKDYGEVTNAIGSTGGGTQDIDLTAGNSVSATVDSSTNTFTFSNPTASDELCGFTLVLTNGGSQTVNWPGTVDWAGGTAPTLTTSGVDVLVFFTIDGGTIWNGFSAGADVK